MPLEKPPAKRRAQPSQDYESLRDERVPGKKRDTPTKRAGAAIINNLSLNEGKNSSGSKFRVLKGNGISNCIQVTAAHSENQGARRTMEDEVFCGGEAFFLKKNDRPGPWTFYGVFDGHGGGGTSSFLKANLHKELVKELKTVTAAHFKSSHKLCQ